MTKVPIINKPGKRWFKVLGWILLVLVVIPLLFYGVLRSSRVQTYLAGRLTHYLSGELNAYVLVKGVDISWFLDLELEGLYISDQRHDTLLYAKNISFDLNKLQYRKRIISFNTIMLEDATIRLHRCQSDSLFNISFLLDYLSSTDTTPAPPGKKWKATIKGIEIRNSRFSLEDDHELPLHGQVDYSHLSLNALNLSLNRFTYLDDTITARINQLSFDERSGFTLKKLQTNILLTPHELSFKDLIIRTDRSNIETDLSFSYKDLSAFNDFVNQVTLKAYLLPSDLETKDLSYFIPGIEKMNNHVVVNCEAEGKINNLKVKDLQLDYGTFTSFRGNVKLSGLPLVDETFIQLTINSFHTNHYDLNTFQLPDGTSLAIPDELTEMGNINIHGRFTGFYNDFVSYAQFNTDIGSVFTDISLKSNTLSGKMEYSGKISTHEFNLGLLLQQQEYFGKVNLKADITGSGITLDELLLNLDGVVDSLYFKGNTFKELRISGGIFDKRFNGNLQVTDQRLGLDFDGYVDFKKLHPVFDFVTRISSAGLNHLNLVKSDSVMTVSTILKAHIEGLEPDSIQGSISLDSTLFIMNRSRYFMKKLDLSVTPEPAGGTKTIKLTSDFINATLSGSYTYDQLVPSFKQFLGRFLPSLVGQAVAPVNEKQPQFVVDILIKDFMPFTSMFIPSLSLNNNTFINGTYHPAENIFSLKAGSSLIGLMGTNWQNVYIEGSSTPTELWLKSGCEHLDVAENIGLDSLFFRAQIQNDTIGFGLGWTNENKKLRNSGDLKGYLSFTDQSTFKLHINPSKTIINDSLWVIPANNVIEVDTQSIRINNLCFNSGDEKINLNGVISKDPLDKLTINLDRFDISNFDFLTLDQDVDFDGFISGKLELLDLLNAPKLLSDITINDFAFNKDKLGNAKITSRWDPSLQALFAKADVIYKGNIGENTPISIQGYYYPRKTENSLDFTIDIEDFKLKTISNFLSSFSSKFTGFASGNLTLKGNLKKPDLEGLVKVQRGVIRIDYLRTEYSFSHDIELGKNFIGFNDVTVYDSLGNKGILNGTIKHDYFTNFRLDLTLKAKDLLAMNTRSVDNDLFYGKAVGTGTVKIHGPIENLVIDVIANTEKGTQVFLPINTTMDISDNEFITFTKTVQDTTHQPAAMATDFTGVTVNLDLDATPDGTIRINMPSDMGNIKASGKGKLKMDVDTRGQFNIYGDYQITEGSFLFTLQNVVNRLFQIQPGGKIIFSGDPYATKINIRAIYKLDVPLTGLRLSPEQLASISKKIPINCIIDLTGNLFNPDLVFKISTQEKDATINQILFTQLDTNNQQQMSEQMIFLLVLKQFKPIERSNPLDLNASMGSSSWDILSSQLNSWLSQISKDFDIGVNYKPGDRLTNDELTVALSTQLFDERVSIDGNFGYNSGSKNPSTTSQNASNLVGDVKVEVKLTNDGRFKVKAFNKSNNVSLFENTAPYTQGVGVFFRKEFDNFGELFKRKKKTPALTP